MKVVISVLPTHLSCCLTCFLPIILALANCGSVADMCSLRTNRHQASRIIVVLVPTKLLLIRSILRPYCRGFQIVPLSSGHAQPRATADACMMIPGLGLAADSGLWVCCS